MRVAYLDCFAGISGDMLLGALVGAGVPVAMLEEAAAAMDVGATLRQTAVDRSGIAAVKMDVMEGERLAESAPGGLEAGHAHPHAPDTAAKAHGRSLTVIKGMIAAAPLRAEARELATRVFQLLGESEAKIHGVDVESIHFHEVGAVDAIVDIVAASAGLVHLGVDAWYCSPVNVGGGTVRCAHGLFPVPAPATADLLRGMPTYSAHLQKELVTPTGAALLRALRPSFGPQPAMRVDTVGYGAGSRNPEGFPNVLRLSLGDTDELASDAVETVSVLETALDDCSPQLLGYVTEEALQQGALDVMLTPVMMKKGRPGTLLTLLCEPAEADRFAALLLRETTTLGVRIRQDRRVSLARAHATVATEYGEIRVKLGTAGAETLNAQPEYEDCRAAAQLHGVPLKAVMLAAARAYGLGEIR